MAWGRSKSSSSGGNPENAGGTDWASKKEKAGKGGGYTVFGKGEDWGKPETSGGSGGTLSEGELLGDE